MTQWTSQQLKCLEAIGVPVYAHVPAAPQQAPVDTNARATAQANIDATAVTTESPASKKTTAATAQPKASKQNTPAAANPKASEQEAPQPEASANKAHYYQLGPWVFEFSQSLPVESYDWLRDLAAYCKSPPTQVSHADKPLSLNKYARNQLSPADKRELWTLLKANR